MTPRQLRLIAVAFGALLLLWGAASLIRRDDGTAPGAAVLPAIAKESVDTVAIVRRADTTLLTRRDSAQWRVNGYPADRTAIISLLGALADTARTAELVAERIASHTSLGVDSASGARVRITGPGRALADLVVGNRTPDMAGGYLRRASDSAVYLVRGPLTELLGRGPDEWRDRRMVSVTPDSVAAIEVTRGARSYRLARTGGPWSFAGSRPAADSAAVRGLLDRYRRAEAAGFASRAQADSAKFRPAERRVRLLRADGSPLVSLALDSTAGAFWGRVEGDSVTYRVESWTADELAPADSTLRAKPASP